MELRLIQRVQMEDDRFWLKKGYKLLSEPESENRIYYRIIGNMVYGKIALRFSDGKKLMVPIDSAEKWLIQRLKELGEIE